MNSAQISYTKVIPLIDFLEAIAYSHKIYFPKSIKAQYEALKKLHE
jgi:hypothetical protein